ncbi:MAG: methylmalonyl-CoA epimerase [Candidatus Promineofilum sp.]|nr:methylmalonyl-CoA epimerase [Promineifilum sp.]MCW5861867.1 methylmalonyl-CoA epimerase [Anaerolineae bacterium]
MIKSINHIAVIVPDLEGALNFWEGALGLKLARTESVPEEGVDVAFLPIGGSNVELLKPTVADTGVARFLEKRGAGIHHMCFEVDDIEATLAQLREHNIQLINEQPVAGHGGRKYAFVHPKSTGGVLVELYELGITN